MVKLSVKAADFELKTNVCFSTSSQINVDIKNREGNATLKGMREAIKNIVFQ